MYVKYIDKKYFTTLKMSQTINFAEIYFVRLRNGVGFYNFRKCICSILEKVN